VTLAVLPNIEAIVGSILRTHSDIAALGANVAGRTPATTTGPWIRVTLMAATDSTSSQIERLVQYVIQLECFAGKAATDSFVGQAEAWGLKAATRAVLKSIEGTITGGAVITEVTFLGDSRIPDTTMEPARERYILLVAIRAHGVSA
jgi:hypothetical protein